MPPRQPVESDEYEEDERGGQDFPMESDPLRTPLERGVAQLTMRDSFSIRRSAQRNQEARLDDRQPLGTPFMRGLQDDRAPGARTIRRQNRARSNRVESERSEPDSVPDETELDPADDDAIHDTPLRPALHGLSKQDLERALRAQEIRAEQAEKELRAFKRGSRMSIRPQDSTTDTPSGPPKPKIKEPWVYKGGYKPLRSVLSWAIRMERYCYACKVPPEDYSVYAESYMNHSVQKWMLGIWPRGYPTWENLKKNMVAEFLPGNHTDKLKELFDNLKQTGSLTAYQVKWRDLRNAIMEAEMDKYSETDMVKAFIKGLRSKDDKLWFQIAACHTMSDITARALELKTAIGTDPNHYERRRRRNHRNGAQTYRANKRLSKLKGSALKKAWDTGACIGCGSSNHYIADCPANKGYLKERIAKMTRRLERYTRQFDSTKATKGSSKKTKRERKYKALHRRRSTSGSSVSESSTTSDSESNEHTSTDTASSDDEPDEHPSENGSSGSSAD